MDYTGLVGKKVVYQFKNKNLTPDGKDEILTRCCYIDFIEEDFGICLKSVDTNEVIMVFAYYDDDGKLANIIESCSII